MYHSKHPNAFSENGHLTVYVDRGTGNNSTAHLKEKIQPAFAVREMTAKSGKVLVINEGWSPYGFDKKMQTATSLKLNCPLTPNRLLHN